MTFDYQGYELKLIQKQRCSDGSAHQYTYIYKFFSPVTQYHYIVRAEYHEQRVFAVKFYCKKDRKSEFKYSKIVNKGDLGNIIMSCARVIPLLLREHPDSSFGFAASRSIDRSNNSMEDYSLTQRYKLYCYMIPLKFGFVTFEHIMYDTISSYLLYNRQSAVTRTEIENMFKNTYQNLYELNI